MDSFINMVFNASSTPSENPKGSPTGSASSETDFEGRLKAIQLEVERKKTEAEREAFLLESLSSFVHPEEREIVQTLENAQEVTEEISDYLTTGSSLLIACYRLKTGKDPSISELIDHYREDPSTSVQTYVEALTFVLAQPTHKVSSWMTEEGWSTAQTQARQLEFGVQVLAEQTQNQDKIRTDPPKTPEEEKAKGSLFDAFGDHADGVKTAALLVGVGVSIYALSKYFSKDDEKKESSPAKTALTVGAIGLGTAWVAGRALGNETVSEWFSKDNDSWVNGRFGQFLKAFGAFEFNRMLAIASHSPTLEEETQCERLAKVFDLKEPYYLWPMLTTKWSDFMDGKACTLFNLPGQKEAEEKVRDRIKRYYKGKIDLFTDLDTLTMGQVFAMGLGRGIFENVDPTTMPEGKGDGVAKHRKEDTKEEAALKLALDKPEGNQEAIVSSCDALLTDLDMLDKRTDGWWGEFMIYFEKAFGWDAFTDTEDDEQYADLKVARKELLALLGQGMEKDHAAFAESEKVVQKLKDFIIENPDPTQWSQTQKDDYALYSNKVFEIRQHVNGTMRYANEQNMQDLVADAEEKFTRGDFEEGGQFALHSLYGVFVLPFEFSIQGTVDGDMIATGLLITQATGAVVSMASADWSKPRLVAIEGAKGALKGPVKVLKYGVYEELYLYRRAFEYTPEELLTKLLKGELSENDFARRLSDTEKYSNRFRNRAFGDARFARDELLKKFRRLEAAAEHRTEWLDALLKDGEITDTAETELKKILSNEKIEEIREYHKAGGAEAAKIRRAAEAAEKIQYELKDGKWIVTVEGKVVGLAETEAEAQKFSKTLAEEAAKKGKTLDAAKLSKCWKFAPVLFKIVDLYATVNLYIRLSDAKTEEEIRTVVAEEGANILSFMIGAKLTFDGLVKLKKPTDPRQATVYAVLSCLGGLLTALGVKEPVGGIIEHFLEGYPNGYDVAQEAAELLQHGTYLSTVRMNKELLQKGADRLLRTEAAELAKKETAKLANEVGAKVVNSEVVQGGKRVATEMAEKMGTQLTRLAEKNFATKLAKTCGRDALEFIMKKAGVKGIIAGGMALVDGPIPIGDALGVLLLAWTAKDVLDLANLIWEGYKLKEELDKRMPLKPTDFKVLEPPELVVKYASVVDAEAAFEMILQEKTAKVQMQREGNAGFEVWTITNKEPSALTVYDLHGKRIAGMNEQDIQKITDAQKEIEQSEKKASTSSSTTGGGGMSHRYA